MINIRPAVVSDSGFIRRCMEELKRAPFDPALFSETLEALTSTGSYFPFVFEFEGSPCGFLGMNIMHQLHHNGKVAEILELIVLPAYRKRKIGQQALEFARALARKENCLVLELATSQSRVDAQRFYLENGFQNSHYKLTMEL